MTFGGRDVAAKAGNRKRKKIKADKGKGRRMGSLDENGWAKGKRL
jgi:hypothetical protein